VVLIAGVLALTACDPTPVPSDPADAAVRIELEPTGSATGSVQLARNSLDHLRPVTNTVVTALFGPPSRVAIDANGGGADFAVFTVPDVFEPGERPSTSVIVGEEAFASLREIGVESVDLTICVPFVPYDLEATPAPAAEAAECASWPLDAESSNVHVAIGLRPEVDRWYWSIGVLAVTLVSTLVAAYLVRGRPLARGRRVAVLAVTGIGVLAFAVSVPLQPAAPHGDNLGVAGLLDGMALVVATWVPVAILPLAAACVALGVMAFLPRRQRGVVYAYPAPT
jgi:hypothetical protein